MCGDTRETQTQFALNVSARLKSVLPICSKPFRMRRPRTPFQCRHVRDDCFNCSAHVPFFCW